MAYSKALLLLCGVLGITVVTNACSCIFGTNNKKFCTAEYVIKAKIKSKMEIPADYQIRYDVKIKRTFKTSPDFDNLSPTQKKVLWTANQSSLCGVYLEVGKTYLLAGFVNADANEMAIGSCNWISTWKNLAKGEKKNIKKVYGKGNNCDTLPPDFNIAPEVVKIVD